MRGEGGGKGGGRHGNSKGGSLGSGGVGSQRGSVRSWDDLRDADACWRARPAAVCLRGEKK